MIKYIIESSYRNNVTILQDGHHYLKNDFP